MIYYTKEDIEIPFLVVKNDQTIGVNDAFLELTGYSLTEILNKSFPILWHHMLRIHVDCKAIIDEAFMFTKDLEAKCVSVHAQANMSSDEIIYWFTELSNSRFKDKNPFLSKLIFENVVGVGIYGTPDFILIHANQSYLNYFPKPYNAKASAYGKPLKEIVPEFADSEEEQSWISVIEKNASLYIKEQYIPMAKDEGVYWNNTLVPIEEKGQVRYVVSILEDVTDCILNREQIRRQADTIRMHKEELDTIIDNISEGIAIFDKDGNYVKTNKKLKEYGILLNKSGRHIEKVGDTLLEGKKYYDSSGKLLGFEDMPIVNILKGKRIINQVVVSKYRDKLQYYEYNGNPIFDAQGNIEFGVVSIKDITDQYEKERLIREQKEQLELILDNMSDAVFIVDQAGNIVLKNKQAEKKVFPDVDPLNFKYDRLYSTYFDMDGNELSLDMLPSMRALKGEGSINFQIKIKNSNIEWLADVIANPVYDEEGAIAMAVVCLRDITDQVMLETARNDTLEEAMAMKDEFLYLITHDFKTPIAVISSALQAIDLICKGEISGKLGKFLDTIRQNTNRQLRLVNNLLDITRITSGHAKHYERDVDIVYITRAIINSVDIYVQQKNIKLNFSTEIPEKVISLDEEKYERILLNLLSNALKFTPNGKAIHVALSLTKRKNKNMICLQIRDEGIGIEKDKQAYIFERFGQVESSLSRQSEGTGLGLHLVKLLVDSIKGTISLESEVGKGSCFTILIPAAKGKTTNSNPQRDSPEDPFASSNSRIVAATAIEFSDLYL